MHTPAGEQHPEGQFAAEQGGWALQLASASSNATAKRVFMVPSRQCVGAQVAAESSQSVDSPCRGAHSPKTQVSLVVTCV